MTSIDVIQEVQQNFIDSSYDVNANRAFPDVRDGLKPGMRACLWTMYKNGFNSNKPHVKSAKIDGHVAANLWPHGTTAIYETFARMSQQFTNNVPEVDFHGANGNIILGGDAIAADRYTEARLAKITEDGMLSGVEKNTVPMILNFSEDEYWPKVLPAIFPRLLVNGSQGIGVSIAQTWLPHNLQETADVIVNYIKTGNINNNYYPDFPTGGTIINKDELDAINTSGKGRVVVEASYKINGNEITFYEMPYQVYIEPVIEKIKELVESDQLPEIKSVFNKSDKKKIALVVDCKKGYDVNVLIKKLFDLTPLRSQYNANQNGIISKTPIMFNLKQAVDVYIEHNTSCIKKEHEYDFNKANDRIEILNGLIKALANIDDIVFIIRNSDNTQDASTKLQNKYDFSDAQCKAILDMRLSKLTHLDGVGLEKELEEKNKVVDFCKEVINNADKQKEILVERLSELAKKYGNPRRTQVIQKEVAKTTKSKSGKEKVVSDVVITFNPLGYVQNIPLAAYKSNGFKAFKITTEDIILLFSNKGKLYRIMPKDIKTCGAKDKGTALGAILPLENDEKIVAAFDCSINEKRPYLMFALANGNVKKSNKLDYIGATRNMRGLKATKADVPVVSVQETNGCVVTLESKTHKISFMADDINLTGKGSNGVKGINIAANDEVVNMTITAPELFNGKIQKRGGKGEKI